MRIAGLLVRPALVGALLGTSLLIMGASPSIADAEERPRRPAVDGAYESDGAWFVEATRPMLRATLSDPDGTDAVRGVFRVYEVATGAVVWEGKTKEYASGSEFTKRVGAELAENRRYRATVTAVDHGGTESAESRGRRFVVDVTPPGEADVKPIRGGQAVYEEGQTAGGVGKKGKFRLKGDGSPGIDFFRYSFDDWETEGTAEVGDQVISFTPHQPGVVRLRVRIVDRAGHESVAADERVYTFVVAAAQQEAWWQFNDDPVPGDVAEDSGPGGFDLSVPGSVDWVAGRWYEGDEPYPPSDPAYRDGALQFTGSSGVVHTDAAVADTTGTFSVAAYVRLNSLADSGTAVSQAGANVSGFGLGFVTGDTGCEHPAGCWEFWMPDTDSPLSDPSMTRVRAALEPVAGEWVMLVGEFVRDRMRISTCHRTEEGPLTVDMGSWADRSAAAWVASGDVQVGSGRVAGGVAQKLRGSVDSVEIFDQGLTESKIRAICGG